MLAKQIELNDESGDKAKSCQRKGRNAVDIILREVGSACDIEERTSSGGVAAVRLHDIKDAYSGPRNVLGDSMLNNNIGLPAVPRDESESFHHRPRVRKKNSRAHTLIPPIPFSLQLFFRNFHTHRVQWESGDFVWRSKISF